MEHVSTHGLSQVRPRCKELGRADNGKMRRKSREKKEKEKISQVFNLLVYAFLFQGIYE